MPERMCEKKMDNEKGIGIDWYEKQRLVGSGQSPSKDKG